MTSNASIGVTLAWTVIIVFSELLAFYLIQKNVDDQSGLNSNLIVAALLFGIVVTYSFRQILLGGTNIPLANFYWIIFSQFGAVLIASLFFNHQIHTKDWIAIVLLFLSLFISYIG